jgi:hypothetical protein
MFGLALTVPLMIILMPYGLISYLWGSMVAMLAIATVLVFLLIKSKGLKFNSLISSLGVAFLSTIIAFTIGLIINELLNAIEPKFRFFPVGLFFYISYFLFLRLFFPAALKNLLTYTPGGNKALSILMLK